MTSISEKNRIFQLKNKHYFYHTIEIVLSYDFIFDYISPGSLVRLVLYKKLYNYYDQSNHTNFYTPHTDK